MRNLKHFSKDLFDRVIGRPTVQHAFLTPLSTRPAATEPLDALAMSGSRPFLVDEYYNGMAARPCNSLFRLMILVLDNFDSFVHNLARYLQRLGQETLVVRNDAINVAGIRALQPHAIVLSPGPCTPREAGCSLDVVRELYTELPMLGVCLGHQTIAAALGGQVVRAPHPMHGRTSPIEHDSLGLFTDLPSPISVCRYHSLAVDEPSLPECLQVTARTPDGVVMALAHRSLPVYGVQFHPEAILTEGGYAILANFLRQAGISPSAYHPDVLQERPPLDIGQTPASQVPVTF